MVDELLAERRAAAVAGEWTVLDASAVLALIGDEPGADVVSSAPDGAVLGAANLAEVIGKVVDLGGRGDRLCLAWPSAAIRRPC